MVTYSYILPIRNEEGALTQLFAEITAVFPTEEKHEIIAINDASTDTTASILKNLSQRYPQLRIINFPVQQGKWAALAAGLQAARGDIIVLLDADGQDDPSEVRKLLPWLDEGYAVVSGWRRRRHDSWHTVFLSRIGNKLVAGLALGQYHDLNSSFKVLRREILPAIPQQGSLLRFLLLFTERAGYRIKEVPIRHRPRQYGVSKFGWLKYLRIMYDLVLVRLLFWGSGRLTKGV